MSKEKRLFWDLIKGRRGLKEEEEDYLRRVEEEVAVEKLKKLKESLEPLTEENNPFEEKEGFSLEIGKKKLEDIGKNFEKVFELENEVEKVSIDWSISSDERDKKRGVFWEEIRKEKLRVFNELLDEKKGNEDFKKIVKVFEDRMYKEEDGDWTTFLFSRTKRDSEGCFMGEEKSNYLIIDKDKLKRFVFMYSVHYPNYIIIEDKQGKKKRVATPDLLVSGFTDGSKEKGELIFWALEPLMRKEEDVVDKREITWAKNKIKKFGIKVNY